MEPTFLEIQPSINREWASWRELVSKPIGAALVAVPVLSPEAVAILNHGLTGWLTWAILLFVLGVALGMFLWYRVGRLWVTPIHLWYRTITGRIRRWPRQDVGSIGLGTASVRGMPIPPQIIFLDLQGRLILRLDAIRWELDDVRRLAGALGVELTGAPEGELAPQYDEALQRSGLAKLILPRRHATALGFVLAALVVLSFMVDYLITKGNP